MVEKSVDKPAMVLGIALVWFSAHIGGGFASGATLYTYFINQSAACLWLPIVSLAMIAFVYWWGWRYAQVHGTYDYRSFNNSFYGKYAPVFSNLYEVLIVFVVIIGAAVAFATGASVLESLVGIPYVPASLIVGGVIFLVCIFGTNVIRRMSVVFSVLMVCALLMIYVPAIALHGDAIAANLANMASAQPAADASSAPSGTLALPALGMALMYGVFQASDVALYVQHMRPVKNARSVGKAMVASYFMNLVFVTLAMLGLLTVAGMPGIADEPVPLLTVIAGLPGGGALGVVAGLLIAIACISTAVMFTGGMVKRLCVLTEGSEAVEQAEDALRPTMRSVLFTALCVIVCCLVAQFGLLPLVSKGYSLLGYVAIFVVTVPYVANFIWCKTKVRHGQRSQEGAQ